LDLDLDVGVLEREVLVGVGIDRNFGMGADNTLNFLFFINCDQLVQLRYFGHIAIPR
jgi:hypothetical protein